MLSSETLFTTWALLDEQGTKQKSRKGQPVRLLAKQEAD
jgi:hypothetical protein